MSVPFLLFLTYRSPLFLMHKNINNTDTRCVCAASAGAWFERVSVFSMPCVAAVQVRAGVFFIIFVISGSMLFHIFLYYAAH